MIYKVEAVKNQKQVVATEEVEADGPIDALFKSRESLNQQLSAWTGQVVVITYRINGVPLRVMLKEAVE